MVVYDFSNQNAVSIEVISSALFLAFAGIYTYYISIYKPKKSNFFLWNDITINQHIAANKPFVRFIYILFFSIAIIALCIELKSYIYVKHVNWFEKIKTVNGKITKIESVKALGTQQETFTLNEKEYSITRDKRYISEINLSVNDSISVDFFENNKIPEVVKIKLYNPG